MAKTITKRRTRKRRQRNQATQDILDSMAELQSYVDRGMTIHDMIQDIRQRHPERVRVAFVPPEPRDYTPSTVRKLREALNMSQAAFAATIGVSRILVQSWERGVREPSPLARRLLDTISANPAGWLAGLSRARRAG
jgi:DNA-binding transcriptional regulator YiaG